MLAADKTLCGIVTPADIAEEFGNMAGPFRVIGEIEEHLRWLVERGQIDLSLLPIAPTPEKVQGAPSKPQDLTMGEIQRIFEAPELCQRVGLKYDRSTFCAELGKIRELRNGLMHFRDPVSSKDLDRLRSFADLLRAECAAVARTPTTTQGAG